LYQHGLQPSSASGRGGEQAKLARGQLPEGKYARALSATQRELAAAYGDAIMRNRRLLDGNKRLSLLAIYTFLGANDVEFIVAEAEAAASPLRPAR